MVFTFYVLIICLFSLEKYLFKCFLLTSKLDFCVIFVGGCFLMHCFTSNQQHRHCLLSTWSHPLAYISTLEAHTGLQCPVALPSQHCPVFMEAGEHRCTCSRKEWTSSEPGCCQNHKTWQKRSRDERQAPFTPLRLSCNQDLVHTIHESIAFWIFLPFFLGSQGALVQCA